MDDEKIERLRDHLENADDWEKLSVEPGILIVKMPAKGRFKPKLGVEIIPMSSEGKPLKRKGIYILSQELLNAYRTVLENSKLDILIPAIEEINKAASREKTDSGKVTDVFEL